MLEQVLSNHCHANKLDQTISNCGKDLLPGCFEGPRTASLTVMHFLFMFSTDCSTVQKPAAPHFPALNAEDTTSSCFTRSSSTPEERLSSHHFTSTPLHSPSTAINAVSPPTFPSNGLVNTPSKVSSEPRKPSTFSRTTSLPLKNPAEKIDPTQYSKDNQISRSTNSSTGDKTDRKESQEMMMEKKSDGTDLRSQHNTEPLAATVSTQNPAVPVAQPPQTRRALCSPLSSHISLRRAKSEWHRMDRALTRQAQSAIPEICTDATMNDRLWSKLEPGNHRDSMSSSSSISSSDTVIDLSLPNLARKSLTILPSASNSCEPPWVSCRHSAVVSCDALRFSKSKSNPNLQQSDCPKDELKPRALQPAQDASEDSPGRLTQRRHTWSRLYMEGLKQSSTKRPPTAVITSTATPSMSKSLGDLTSDDISCNFDSKYRSISRSFIVRSTRDQLCKGSLQKSRPKSDLTEQLRKLTDVEPLTPSDFAPQNRPKDTQEEFVDETLVRRTSSRSQSRVRYIANRAKKAQERQRLQGLIQGRSASFSLTGSIGSRSSASPIEERGNPEGACCVARSPCSTLDLLSQLTPIESPSPTQSQSSSDPENSEVFFMLKL